MMSVFPRCSQKLLSLIIATLLGSLFLSSPSRAADVMESEKISEAISQLTADDAKAVEADQWLQTQMISTHKNQVELLKLLQTMLPEPADDSYEIYAELAIQLGTKISSHLERFDHNQRFSDIALVLIEFYERLQQFRMMLFQGKAGLHKETSQLLTPIYRQISKDLLSITRWYTANPEKLIDPKTGVVFADDQLISLKTRIDALYQAISIDVFTSLDEIEREKTTSAPSTIPRPTESIKPTPKETAAAKKPRIDLVSYAKFLAREENPMHMRQEILPQIIEALAQTEKPIEAYEYEAVFDVFFSIPYHTSMTPMIINAIKEHATISLKMHYSEQAKQLLLEKLRKFQSTLPLQKTSAEYSMIAETIATIESMGEHKASKDRPSPAGPCEDIF